MGFPILLQCLKFKEILNFNHVLTYFKGRNASINITIKQEFLWNFVFSYFKCKMNERFLVGIKLYGSIV